MAVSPTRVLGVDPGSAATGWAVISRRGHQYILHDSGVIRPRGTDRAPRLGDLAQRLEIVIAGARPDEAAVETPFTGRNPKSAMVLAEARGVILGVLGVAGISVVGYSPAEVKSAIVGHGRADKAQVVFMVTRFLNLASPPAQDAADAMAVALTHLHRRGWPAAR